MDPKTPAKERSHSGPSSWRLLGVAKKEGSTGGIVSDQLAALPGVSNEAFCRSHLVAMNCFA